MQNPTRRPLPDISCTMQTSPIALGHAGLVRLLLGAWLAIVPAGGCVDPAEVQDASYVTPVQVIDWRDEVIYQIVVDRFADGDPNNNFNVDRTAMGSYHGGDWQGIIDHLDYLETLGVTALWISPVVKNIESDAGFASYHGYWTQNFLEVNPHFGDLAKLRELVDACHRRGIKVILDIVTNHIGQLFYYDINGNGQPDEFLIGGGGTAYGSENHDFSSNLTRTTEWDPEYDSRGVQAFTSLGESGPAPIEWVYDPAINRVPPEPPEFQNPDWYNRRGRVTVWRHEQEACQWVTGNPDPGYWWDVPECRAYLREQEMRGDFPGGLKDLDTTRQDVRDALYRVFAYWIEAASFDGFRIDTLKHVEHDFWQNFCPRIRRRAKELGKQNFFMFGEAFDGNDELLGSYVGEDQVDSVFYFSQKYRVFEGVFLHGNPTRDVEDLWNERQVNYPDTPNVDGPVDAQGRGISPRQLLVNFMDNHDVARFRFLRNDTRTLHSALFHLLTWDGIPCIYYGTEQRFDGGNDPANREDLWDSGYDTQNGTFRLIQTLIALRKQYAPLRRGTVQFRWTSTSPSDSGAEDAGILAFERIYGDEVVLVVQNASDGQSSATTSGGQPMATSFPSGTRLVNVFCMEDESSDLGAHVCSPAEQDASAVVVGPGGTLSVTVPPRGGLILVAR